MGSHILGTIDLDAHRLDHDLRYLNDVPRVKEEYDEFASGHWQNVSLWNSTGDPDDSVYRDIPGAALPTPHSEHVPYLDELVRTVFKADMVKMVRGRSILDAVLLPHRDYAELDKTSEQYFRVFVALENNPDAFHSDEGGVFSMRRGEIWFLDAGSVHSAVNFSHASRQCLCVDFAFDGPFKEQEVFADPATYKPRFDLDYAARRPFTQRRREDLLTLGRVVDQDNFADILFLLAKVHFRYDVPALETYEWMTEICEASGSESLVSKAKQIARFAVDRDFGQRLSLTPVAA